MGTDGRIPGWLLDERSTIGRENLDPAHVERLIGPRTTGIIGVHLWGWPCAVEALAAIARRHGLHLVYDAAHAISTDRPEAFTEVVVDFLERHEAFVISRAETVIHP